jgi:SAM-dependent methyltransferase
MSTSIKEPEELRKIYERRFERMLVYRNQVWAVLVEDFFQRYVQPGDRVLDLGCGYGEFVNHVRCARKYGMDLNPQTPRHLAADVQFLFQDCSTPWQLPDGSLDVVFTSNFFEHLPDKLALRSTLREAARCLRPGGRLIALGPNIKFVQGAYWDFWDHFPLSHGDVAGGGDGNQRLSHGGKPPALPALLDGEPFALSAMDAPRLPASAVDLAAPGQTIFRRGRTRMNHPNARA